MTRNKRSMFRKTALQHYAQGWDKPVLPRSVAPPVFTFLWILLGLLFIATFFAWSGKIPTYVLGSGLVLDQSLTSTDSSSQAVALIFLPASPSLALRPGLPVQVQIGSTGPYLTTITSVEQAAMSPDAIRQRYSLNGPLAEAITQPSFVLTVKLGPPFSATMYAGSLVRAQIQVRSQRILSLLPGLDQLIGA